MSSLNRDSFATILSARGVTFGALSERIKISEGDLRKEIERDGGPSTKVLDALARELAVPPFLFFASKVPNLQAPLIDFRRTVEGPVRLSAAATRAVDAARRIQELAAKSGVPLTKLPTASLAELQGDQFVGQIRQMAGLTLDMQRAAKDADAFYKICRFQVESLGVFVLQRSYPSEDGSGFALASENAPLMVINSLQQLPARRSFTLVHELAHLLLRRSGVSNPFTIHNEIEKAANRFAAKFLLPSELILGEFRSRRLGARPSRQDVAALAAALKVSQQATILRLERLKVVAPGSYNKWVKEVGALNPDVRGAKGGGRRVEEAKYKLAAFGFTFARVFSSAIDKSAVMDIDVRRASGLRTQYQSEYFEFALGARASDAEE